MNLKESNKEIIKNLYFYLEEILLLFPSFFFEKEICKDILNECISYCDELIKKNKDFVKEIHKDNLNEFIYYSNELIKKNEDFFKLKHKLLLFLYSLDEKRTDILNIDKIDSDLKIERDILMFIRKKDDKYEDLKKLLKNEKISKETKFFLNREIAITYFEKEEYQKCKEILDGLLKNSLNINDKNRIILDTLHVFKKQYISHNKTETNEIKTESNKIISDEDNENYELIKEVIKKLNQIINQSVLKDIYYEAINLREELYNLLEPDIIMLNSNPLKLLDYSDVHPNNQFYILNEINNDIDIFIKIKADILNEHNLDLALKGKGEILIIQSDHYTNNGDIFLEYENCETKILLFNNIRRL